MSEDQVRRFSRQALERTFKQWDKNGDGVITRDEVRGALNEVASMIGGSVSEPEIDSVFRRHDKDGDGVITLEEFCSISQL
ncbi:hypothetical protein SNEBB_003482 [Seison nebaliae]|nr:hypothetical protein SNEBB_003482 [Seison nebaliae]